MQQLQVATAIHRQWVRSGAAIAAAFAVVTYATAQSCNVGPAVALPAVCGVQLASPSVNCTVPTDMQPGSGSPPFYLIQRAANIFSWQVFMALQWPAAKTERGKPDPAAKLGAAGPTVWETWREAGEVFRHNASGPLAPLGWNAAPDIPAACQGADRVLFRTSKVDDTLSDVNQPTVATMTRPMTLRDQRSEATRYEIRMNKVAYDAITATGNQWWNGERQATLNSVSFPDGSMIVKAAWTPIPDDANLSRFRVINACVCDAAGPGGGQQLRCAKNGAHRLSLDEQNPKRAAMVVVHLRAS